MAVRRTGLAVKGTGIAFRDTSIAVKDKSTGVRCRTKSDFKKAALAKPSTFLYLNCLKYFLSFKTILLVTQYPVVSLNKLVL